MIHNSCLVTGGAGFIGSHLVERLLKDGHRVTVVTRSSTASLCHLQNNRNLSVVKTDISDPKNRLEECCRGVDWVFHLAGKSNIASSINTPMDYHKANVSSTLYVLEACRKAKIKKFVYAASATCYGVPDVYPTPETAKIKPQNPYALTKYLGEVYTLCWGQVYKLPVVSLRLFDIYGSRINKYGTYGPLLSIFMAQKLKGIPFTVAGDGRQRRDFTYVTDVVDAFIMAGASKISGEVFNVGSGKIHSINEMVKLLKGSVAYIAKRPGERDCNFADISKIKRMLGWRPKVSFEEGMRKVLQAEGHMGKRGKK